jgi:hypothetical protein
VIGDLLLIGLQTPCSTLPASTYFPTTYVLLPHRRESFDMLITPSNQPSVGLINGELTIPGNLLRREVFDPIVNQVCGENLITQE